MGTWRTLGHPPPEALSAARLEAHWASQVLSAFGDSQLPHREDYRHRAMSWSDENEALISFQESPEGLSLALDLGDLRLLMLERGARVATMDLAGETLDDAFAWVNTQLPDGATPVVPLDTSRIPPHAVGSGAVFIRADPDASLELARWFANVAGLLETVRAREPHAAPVLCWPHHFDLATLVVLDPDDDPEEARSIGVGMVPGDDSYAEPYLYVTPWPYPESPTLHDLPSGGRWHTESWLGGVLNAYELVALVASDAQRASAQAFLDQATRACRVLLGAPPTTAAVDPTPPPAAAWDSDA